MLPSLAYFTLRSEGVQTWLTTKAADYLSRELDAKVTVGGVNISWFLNVVLEDIRLFDRNDNSLLYARKMEFDVDKISFSRRNLLIDKLVFHQAELNMAKYHDEEFYNFQFFIDYFDNGKTTDTISLPGWNVVLKSFEFRNSGLSFIDYDAEHLENGFDPLNFAFRELYLSIADISFERDTLQANVTNFSLKESKGLEINNISANLMISPNGSYANNLFINTGNSSLEMDVEFDYEAFQDFKSFADKVVMSFKINSSSLQLYELGYFITPLYGLDNKLVLHGSISGTLSNIRGNNVWLHFGELTNFHGNFFLSGLPDIQETFLNFSVEHLVTTRNDLQSFILPHDTGVKNLSLPAELDNLGISYFTGNLTGFIYDFVAYGSLRTDLGELKSDIAIRSNDDFTKVSYNGSLATAGFNLGKLTNESMNLGLIAFDANLNGSGIDFSSLDVTMQGSVSKLEFNDYTYRNMEVAGNLSDKRFSGNLLVDDTNLFVDFNGLVDFSEDIPRLNFTAQIEDANLTLLNIYQRDSVYHSVISTILSVEGKGKNLNDIQGDLTAYSTVYKEIIPEDDGVLNYLHTDLLSLQSFQSEVNGQTLLRFNSDYLDLRVEGFLNFERLNKDITGFLAHYLPSRFPVDKDEIADADFSQKGEFEINFKKTEELTGIFFPKLNLSENIFINGKFDMRKRDLGVKGNSEYIIFGNNRLDNFSLAISSDKEKIEILNKADRLFLSDSIWMEQFVLSADIYEDNLDITSKWENQNSEFNNSGFIDAQANVLSPHKTEFVIKPSYAYINDSLWSVSSSNRILIDSAYIEIENFMLYKNEEFLKVDGRLSDEPSDVLIILLNNFNTESLSYFLRDRKIDFAGLASGELTLSNIKNTPNIATELLIRDFAFNNDHLGDLSLNSVWDATEKAFKIDAEVIYYGNVGFNKPLIARGYFYPESEQDNFDLDIFIENLQMSIFSRYLEGFASNFRGLASGRLRLDGPLSSPELSGRARLVRTGFRVNYLNTAYSFAHEIEVGKDYFRFDNLTLNDTIGNSANVSGIIRHNRFMDFSLDISFLLDRIAVLNTLPHHNELFYGRAFATGLLRVHGPANDITLDISAQANRGTQFFLPLDSRGEFSETSFISFVSPDKVNGGLSTLPAPQISGIALNFDLEVTPESEIQIIFDSQIGDILRGRGFGDLKFEINSQGAFNMYGDFTIQDGDYLFTLQNLINKRFRMEQGGVIRWSGDLYDADIDMRAFYRLRTSLFDLAANQTDTSDVYRRRVPVETVLHLQDKLFNPSISFDIRLPGGDESTREMIERIITTEQEMNRQVFSLLILNRFVPPEDGLNTALGYGMGSTSSELLSNQLSNWLSQISSDFDIGINYRPGDEISSQEIEVALSTQLFDDRVVIDGNVGVAGNHPAQSQRASNIIGDVNVEVKITPEGKFRVKAFNRSNTFDLLNTNAPYTQGVGVFYRREFDNISEIFRRRPGTVLEIPELDMPEYPEYPEIEALRPGSDNADQ